MGQNSSCRGSCRLRNTRQGSSGTEPRASAHVHVCLLLCPHAHHQVIRRKCAAAGAGGRRRSFSVDTPCGRGSSSPLHAPGQLLRGHSMSADVSQLLAAGWPAAGASGAAGGSAHVCASAPSWTPVDASQQPSCEGSCTLPLSRASSATPPHLSFTTAPPWPAALAISTSPSAAASRGGSPGPPAAAAAGVSAAGRQGPLPLAAALHVSTTELAREFAVMKRLSHPNVVTLHEVRMAAWLLWCPWALSCSCQASA